MTNALEKFNKSQIENLPEKKIDDFQVGDTVAVEVNIYENGEFLRVQVFEGVCIARFNRSLHSSFIVRKISYNEGVERKFQLHSYCVKSVTRLRRGIVRRAKLYYLRDRRGKAMRIRERLPVRVAKVAGAARTPAKLSKAK